MSYNRCMSRQRFQLTPEATFALQAAKLAEKNGSTRARLQSVRLYGLGFPVETIQTVTGISRSRLMEYCRAYREQGVEALADRRQGGNNYKLSKAQVTELTTKLHQYTPRSLFGPEAATPKQQLGLALGGNPSARVSTELDRGASRNTFLRLVRRLPLPEPEAPEVIGIDDWAWKKGQRYGTIITDLERQCPIALLEDREAETVAAWLKEHPTIRIIARDRATREAGRGD
jgi:transposase